ncbi:MAG: GNAT family N-acetyltransferase [Candidatus Lokiarchaeota archaeon]|nr:GNAT family N-acetyltransferase [Candidatus Lokiarchaeota archaeon]
MESTITECGESDWEHFVSLEFETMKTLSDTHYKKLVEENPGKTESELIQVYGKSLKEDFDFTSPDCRIFVAKNDESYAGHVWIAYRNSEDPWDFECPVWIYDITIHPDFRRQGLGKRLMEQAELWTKERGRNIGLFVHYQNEAAISLYKTTGYRIKMIPISKALSNIRGLLDSSIEFRKVTKEDQAWLEKIGFEVFKKKVQYSINKDETTILNKYRELCKKIEEKENQVRYVGINNQQELVVSIWVSEAEFNEDFAYVHEVVFDEKISSDTIHKEILHQLEEAAAAIGKKKLYVLLHDADGIDWTTFQKYGYKIPGFFMEKRLK